MPRTTDLSANFSRNYCALAMNQKELAQRVCLPSVDDHIVGEPPQLRIHRSRYSLSLSPEVVEKVGAHTSAETILVFGVGLGELVVEVLRTNPNATVIAWDRDPVMLRKAMESQDFSGAMYRGQLRLALGPCTVATLLLPPIHCLPRGRQARRRVRGKQWIRMVLAPPLPRRKHRLHSSPLSVHRTVVVQSG